MLQPCLRCPEWAGPLEGNALFTPVFSAPGPGAHIGAALLEALPTLGPGIKLQGRELCSQRGITSFTLSFVMGKSAFSADLWPQVLSEELVVVLESMGAEKGLRNNGAQSPAS